MTDDGNAVTGREVKGRREDLGLNVSQLAREAGVYRARVKALENGDEAVTGATIGKIRNALNRLESVKGVGACEVVTTLCEVVITLPDGVQVEFFGTSEQSLDWTLEFLAGRDSAPA